MAIFVVFFPEKYEHENLILEKKNKFLFTTVKPKDKFFLKGEKTTKKKYVCVCESDQ